MSEAHYLNKYSAHKNCFKSTEMYHLPSTWHKAHHLCFTSHFYWFPSVILLLPLVVLEENFKH